jgi:hypothetical protein
VLSILIIFGCFACFYLYTAPIGEDKNLIQGYW